MRFDFVRSGNVTAVAFSEYTPKTRGYLEIIAPTGTVPVELRPSTGVVLECVQAPNSGMFRLKLHPDGMITNLYREGDESMIYNNNIENSMFGYINASRL